MKNTAILAAMSSRRQFVVYRAIQRPDGKIDKIPCDPYTGYNVTAHDSAHWMPPFEALSWAEQWTLQTGVTYGVGLVLYDDCGIFCLDLDHCRAANGGWFPHVSAFCDRFPGAALETSVSGTGRHVLMSYTGPLPVHGVDNRVYRMQGYSKNRFIGLTGRDAEGSVLMDHTQALHRFLLEYFPARIEPDHGTEWTSEPVAAWRGPTDDGELINRALRSHGLRAIVGAGAAFGDLWEARDDTLARVFPSERGDIYDRSAADQSLANHLAFWTGNNCERMLGLMTQSSLVREKWNRVDGYLKPTILEACASQREWYAERGSDPREHGPDHTDSGTVSTVGARPPAGMAEAFTSSLPISAGVPLPPTAAAGTVPEPPGIPQKSIDTLAPGDIPFPPIALPPVGEYVHVHMMKDVFANMCYVEDIHSIQLPEGSRTTKDRFDAMYGGPLYAMTADGQKPTKSAWDAFVLSEIHRFPRAETQCFKPSEPLGVIHVREGRREINCYRPANVRRIPGDPTPFLDLVRRMLPAGRDSEILIFYMAACCQNLGVKFKWAPFVQGTKGNGKTTIGQVLEYCMSLRYTHWAKADQIGEKFNSVFVDKLLVIVDEMYSDDARELQEVLKLLVTAMRIEVRPMHAEKIMKEICFNLLLFSNHQNGVRIDMDERRYAALFCAQQGKSDKIRDGLTKPYFIALHKWLAADGYAIVYDYLMNLAIPDELNPATECIEAPTTTSTDLAATASLGSAEQEVLEAIKQSQDGFRNGWISSNAVDTLLMRCGKDRAIPRNARRHLVLSLGYEPHPSLVDGVSTVAMPDGSFPRIYVTRNHPWSVPHLSGQQVRDGFIEGQKT